MSADAERVPVAWRYRVRPGGLWFLTDDPRPHVGREVEREPLYSADTIAALRKVIAAADAMRAADHLIGPGGVDACPKCIAEKAYDLERAAIDAAQSTEGER